MASNLKKYLDHKFLLASQETYRIFQLVFEKLPEATKQEWLETGEVALDLDFSLRFKGERVEFDSTGLRIPIPVDFFEGSDERLE